MDRHETSLQRTHVRCVRNKQKRKKEKNTYTHMKRKEQFAAKDFRGNIFPPFVFSFAESKNLIFPRIFSSFV